mmetsp:Transcript_114116/g.261903  ORF Transcript_114116/g.261903 Transcript_114116/m.261903 type:complete len:305 (-) Transcript_114116:39-953(-)
MGLRMAFVVAVGALALHMRKPAEVKRDCSPLRFVGDTSDEETGEAERASFISRFQPCGYYKDCTDDFGWPHDLIEANRDFPGQGVGNMVHGRVYRVQFDGYFGDHGGERCLEVPVRFEKSLIGTRGSSWGVQYGNNYDCLGYCGVGCAPVIYGDCMDCMKHDVCSAFKTIWQRGKTKGYCDDLDCGDEAAQALWSCDDTAPCTGNPEGFWSRVVVAWHPGDCGQWAMDGRNGIPAEAGGTWFLYGHKTLREGLRCRWRATMLGAASATKWLAGKLGLWAPEVNTGQIWKPHSDPDHEDYREEAC